MEGRGARKIPQGFFGGWGGGGVSRAPAVAAGPRDEVKATEAVQPWPPELPAPPWPPELPAPPWLQSPQTHPVCSALDVFPLSLSCTSLPPLPSGLLRHGTCLPGGGSYVTFMVCVGFVFPVIISVSLFGNFPVLV